MEGGDGEDGGEDGVSAVIHAHHAVFHLPPDAVVGIPDDCGGVAAAPGNADVSDGMAVHRHTVVGGVDDGNIAVAGVVETILRHIVAKKA